MKIDQYHSKTSIQTSKKSEIEQIFERIRTHNIEIPKTDRPGNVFCSRTSFGRKHKDISEFTGLMFMDLDNCTDHKKVKELFINIEHTFASWYSSSGVNVHALIKIPVCKDIDEYKRRFGSFIALLEPYLEGIATIDKITSNPTQLAFESYDPEIYINDAPESFTLMMPKPKRVPVPAAVSTPTNSRAEWVLNWVHNKITRIDAPGYTQLLANAKTLGGYVSGGYVDRDTAHAHLLKAIGNNPYFNSNDSSGSLQTYAKGGAAAFESGLSAPIKWIDND